MFVKNVKIDMKKFKPMDKNESENRKTATGKEILNHNLFPKLPAVEKNQHRYGEEDFPSPSPSPVDNISQETQVKIPLAFCPHCNAERQMKWKPPDKREKNMESWFVCAACGYDKLEIKRMSHAEAVEINMKEKNERGKYEQRQS